MECRRIILVGKGGSGKDYARKKLENLGLKYCASHTSRPPRNGEIDGKDYFFISLDEAKSLINRSNFFYEHVEFNGWIYGTSIREFESSNLFIMTPKGISNLKPEDRESSAIFYLDIEESVRRQRLSVRRDADSVERRLLADEKDFENFTDYDYRITNPDFEASEEWIDVAKLKNF